VGTSSTQLPTDSYCTGDYSWIYHTSPYPPSHIVWFIASLPKGYFLMSTRSQGGGSFVIRRDPSLPRGPQFPYFVSWEELMPAAFHRPQVSARWFISLPRSVLSPSPSLLRFLSPALICLEKRGQKRQKSLNLACCHRTGWTWLAHLQTGKK
jgi:hypothetical protein